MWKLGVHAIAIHSSFIMLFRTVAAIFATFVLGVHSQTFPNPEAVSGNTAIHDPTMCKDASGKYWLFGRCRNSGDCTT